MYYARNSYNKRCCMALMQKCIGRTFIVFDTETTGINKEKDYIVEFAAMKYIVKNSQVPELIDKIDLYMRPPFLMDQKVIDIHGITNEFLMDKPNEKDCIQKIEDFFGDRPIILGYNIDFDYAMLSSLFQRNNRQLQVSAILDVMEMGYDVCFGNEFKDHKLSTLVSALGLDAGLDFHNALDDTIATYRLLLYCYEEYKNSAPPLNEEPVYVNSVYYWKGFRKEQAGVYLKTNLGNIYYSTFLKRWCSSQVNLQICNIDAMESYVLRKLNISLSEFGKMTQKKFDLLKTACKERGIYL